MARCRQCCVLCCSILSSQCIQSRFFGAFRGSLANVVVAVVVDEKRECEKEKNPKQKKKTTWFSFAKTLSPSYWNGRKCDWPHSAYTSMTIHTKPIRHITQLNQAISSEAYGWHRLCLFLVPCSRPIATNQTVGFWLWCADSEMCLRARVLLCQMNRNDIAIGHLSHSNANNEAKKNIKTETQTTSNYKVIIGYFHWMLICYRNNRKVAPTTTIPVCFVWFDDALPVTATTTTA